MREIPFGRPLIGDEEKIAVLKALESPQLVHGPISKQFEEEFSTFLGNNAFATSVSSATTGLYLAYLSLGLGPGDEVIVTSLTHVATANSIIACGAEPIFVDIDISSGNIDYNSIERYVTKRTKAISVVHYLGNPVDMTEITKISKKYGLKIVEDCALALGSRIGEKHVGLFGDFGVFSFYPAKHITTGEGGMLVSKTRSLISIAEKIKSFYYDKGANDRSIPGVYDIEGFGMNFRMSEVTAAIGIEQLKKLPYFLIQRKRNFTKYLEYSKILDDFGQFIVKENTFAYNSHYCICFLLRPEISDIRNDVIRELKSNGIGTSVYYPIVIPYSKYYRSRKSSVHSIQENSFPNAERISSSSIALPVGPHLELQDVDRVCLTLRNLISKKTEQN